MYQRSDVLCEAEAGEEGHDMINGHFGERDIAW
jgi:hypothetical protein